MKKPSVYICTPMYGGNCFGPYLQSIIRLVKLLDKHGIENDHADIVNESLIPRARNVLVKRFLQTNHTHLLFVDSDIIFDANDVIRMLQADKEVICGIYPKKEVNWDNVAKAAISGVKPDHLKYFVGNPVMNPISGGEFKDFNTPVKIKNGGTGFMLIKREVFETLEKVVPTFWSQDEEEFSVFFDTSLEKHADGRNDYLSEDYHFCKLWREAGGDVYAAPWVVLEHIGIYSFSGAFGRTPVYK
jgi:hypothetical protein